MATIPGTIPLGGTIAPTDSEDVYATHISNYGQGGVHHAADIAARDAITAGRRVEGMICTVADSDGAGTPAVYQLVGGTANEDWREFAVGGGGGQSQGGATALSSNLTATAYRTSTFSLTGGGLAYAIGMARLDADSNTELFSIREGGIVCRDAGWVRATCRFTIASSASVPDYAGIYLTKNEDGAYHTNAGNFKRNEVSSGTMELTCNGILKVDAGDVVYMKGSAQSNCIVASAAMCINYIGGAAAGGGAGQDGKSAYEVAVANGFDGTEAAWLASLKGEDGQDGQPGADGKSAFQIAGENGFRGSITDWLASLKGADGSDHGEPDVIRCNSNSISFPKSADTKAPLSVVLYNTGSGFAADGGDVLCLRGGVVLITATAVTNPPSGNAAAQGYTRLKIQLVRPDDSTVIVLTDAKTTAAVSSSAFNTGALMLGVEAGSRLRAFLNPDIARTGTVLLQAAYLSANGLSAYEVAVKNGFVGAEEAWLESISKIQLAEPALDWANIADVDAAATTEGNYTVRQFTADTDGLVLFTCVGAAKTVTQAADATGMVISVNGYTVQAGNIHRNKSTMALSQRVSKGDVVRCMFITVDATFNSLKLVPVKASNALLKTYSTTEADTGKVWIDGRPIYRTALETTTIAKTGVWNTLATVPDVDDVIALSGVFRTPNGYSIATNYTSGSSTMIALAYNHAASTLVEHHSNASYNDVPLRVVFEYVKAQA